MGSQCFSFLEFEKGSMGPLMMGGGRGEAQKFLAVTGLRWMAGPWVTQEIDAQNWVKLTKAQNVA